MNEITLTINGASHTVTVPPMKRLLDVLREDLHLTGAKEGCGEGECGSCSVLIDRGNGGELTNSCLVPVLQAEGSRITTIEGLSAKGDHPLQKAWIAEQVPQCGYCQSGQIMQAADLLAKTPKPTREQIVQHMDGNICRCGTYAQIIEAIQSVA